MCRLASHRTFNLEHPPMSRDSLGPLPPARLEGSNPRADVRRPGRVLGPRVLQEGAVVLDGAGGLASLFVEETEVVVGGGAVRVGVERADEAPLGVHRLACRL